MADKLDGSSRISRSKEAFLQNIARITRRSANGILIGFIFAEHWNRLLSR
jgi:hypothetical protein